MDGIQLTIMAAFFIVATIGYAWAMASRGWRGKQELPATSSGSPTKKTVTPAPGKTIAQPQVQPQSPLRTSPRTFPQTPLQPVSAQVQATQQAAAQTPNPKGVRSFRGPRLGGLFGSKAPKPPKAPKKQAPPKPSHPKQKGVGKGFMFWRKKEGSPEGKTTAVTVKAKGGKAQQLVQVEATQQSLAPQERVLVDSYSVYDPFVRIVISLEPDGSNRYIVVEPELTRKEREQLKQLRQALKDGLSLDASKFTPEAARHYLEEQTKDLVKKFGLKFPADTYAKLFYFIERDFLRYGKLDPLMRDPNIEDISCNGPEVPIYVFHRTFESIPTNVSFKTQEALERYILRLAYMSGRHISVAEPVVDAALPEGSRIQMTFGSEITKKGSTFTIRKFKEDPYSIVDLVKFGTIDAEIAATLWYALENKGSILLSGGTASGKTTTINTLAVFIRPEAKIVTIEDTPEINLVHSNWIESVSRQGTSGMGEVTLYDLLRAALRQRPDFIIVGEVRGEEANTMFQALSTGHSGMSSVHADSIQAVFNRLTNPPMSIPRNLIPSINFILQQNRITVDQKPSRRILSVTEVVGMDARTNEIITNEAYRYNPEKDAYVFTGRSYIMEKFAKTKGVPVEEIRSEINTRKAVIQWMVDQNIRKYSEVAKIVQRYYTDKSELLAEIGAIAA